MQPYEKAQTKSKKEIMTNNFLGGIFWAIGTTVGLALIVTIVGFLSKHFNFVSVIGSFVTDIVKFVNTHQ